MRDTKSVFKLIFVLINYQTCTFPLMLLLEQNKKSENNEEILVLYVGGKPQRIIPEKFNPHSQK